MDELVYAALGESAKNAQDISALSDYVTINPVDGVVTIPMLGKKSCKVKTTVTGNTAFAVVVTDPAAGCEILLKLTYTDGGAVTWTMSAGSTTTWKGGSAPAFTDGKTYRIAAFYKAANVWHNANGGEW